MAAARKRALKVFFDTNVLYTQVASDLFRAEISEFLSEPLKDPHLDVTWHIPEVVVSEREYQMNTRAAELLPSLSKLERVLGHQLGISAEIVRERIASTVQRQLTAHKVSVVSLDTDKVAWPGVIEAAVKRLPPFEAGDKEKGFRDALIVETFLQEMEKSPRTPSVCLLAFISQDELVRQAVVSRTTAAKNVRVLADLDELKSLVNTLASEVSEEYVEELRAKAAPLFWTTPDDKETLYYTAEVRQRIRDTFGAELDKVPDGMARVTDKKHYITPTPAFLRKDGATLHWGSKVRVEQEIFRTRKPTEISQPSTGGAATAPANSLLSGLLTLASDEVAAIRSLTFYAMWSTRVNTKKQLSAARFEQVIYDSSATELKPNAGAA